MRIALVHDYLAQAGGAEKVLKAFHEIWPEAPIFVLFHDQNKITDFNKNNIRESLLSKFPFIHSHFPWYLPLMPLIIEKHNLENFDVVLSSTSAFAKGVLTGPGTLHISYCHTPARYLWTDARRYIADLRYSPLIKVILPRLVSKLRLWDKMSADRVDYFVTNSQNVRRRIGKFYRRDSAVIYPPVDVNNFFISPAVGDYYAAGGRLVAYKNLELAIKTFNRLRWPLKIFGIGPEMKRLQRMAKPNIAFLERITEAEKAKLLSGARAFIHPQNEDFGITPLEAMASGRPVIAYAAGGALETVKQGETGLFFHRQRWEDLFDLLLNFDHQNWDSPAIRNHAANFDVVNFKQAIKQYVEHHYEEFQCGLCQPTLIH